MSEKLTKKQQKALQFRQNKGKEEEKAAEVAEATTQPPQKKKRKTRRGKKGRGANSSGKNRFLVFVGGLPNNVTPNELQAHFKSSGPDHIRIRNEKHIAFLEFDGDKDPQGIQRRMDMALLQTGTLLRGDKRINVELTVGGGGNSRDRVAKLQEKNAKLQQETTARLHNLKKGGAVKKEEKDSSNSSSTGIHPDRLRLLQK